MHRSTSQANFARPSEWRLPTAFLRMARGLVRAPVSALAVRDLPRGQGAPVVLLPGYLTSDGSMLPLKWALRALGHDARTWGLGRNHGRIEQLTEQMLTRLERIEAEGCGPTHLVGWSWGGVVAREVARRCPERVAQVITIGSPINGGPKHTVFAASYERRGIDLDRVAEFAERREQLPVPVPLTVVYSMVDEVVAWQACLDKHSDNRIRHHHVQAGHLEMGLSHEVLRVVAAALVDPPGAVDAPESGRRHPEIGGGRLRSPADR